MNVAWGGQCGYHRCIEPPLNHKTTENLKHTKAFVEHRHRRYSGNLRLISALCRDAKRTRSSGKAGVHVTRSGFVDAPVIDEYPLTLECKVIEMQEALGEMHVVGEVVNMRRRVDTGCTGQSGSGQVAPDLLRFRIAFLSRTRRYSRQGVQGRK